MRTILCVLMLSALTVGAVLAQGDEIIHFTNGTTMPIRSHSVADGMIHVDLGTNSYMAFPIGMVEKVTKSGVEIELTHSSALRNRMAQSHRAAGADLALRAESTNVDQELTREEKIRRYTERARNGGIDPKGAQPYQRSTSAHGIRSVDMDGNASFRSHSVGDQPNLSGKRLSYVRPSNRKTVGGKVVDVRALPNTAKVELVTKSRAITSKTSGRSGGSDN